MHLTLSQDTLGDTEFTLYGAHQGFPAYEVLVDHKLVYTYDPLTSDADPFTGLSDPLQVKTPFIGGLITAKTELLANGSFEETPTEAPLRAGSGWAGYASIPGWTTIPGSADLELAEAGYLGIGGDGHWLDTQGSPGGIDIAQAATVGAGTTAHLTATVAAGLLTSPSEHLQFLFDGTVVKDVSVADFDGTLNTYKDFTADVTGQGLVDTLEIRSVGANGNYGFSLDKVSLTVGGDLIERTLFDPSTIPPPNFG